MINPIFIAMALGLSFGAFLGYRGSKYVAIRFGNTPLLQTLASVGGALALLPAFFLSIVVGGSLGGSYGEVLFGSVGVPIGLCVGMAFVLAAGIILGALAGALLGRLIVFARSQST